jgi:hypothetical protein
MRDRESLNESPSPAISKDHSMELNILEKRGRNAVELM